MTELSRDDEQAADQAATETVALWRRILALTGIDAAIGWSTVSQFWSILLGPLTLALIAWRLTPDQQGYYFTFSAIAALQMVFELGLASVLQQCVSHERAFLEWQPDGTLGGSEHHERRLATLVQTALRWYAVAGSLFAVALLAGGTWFLATSRQSVGGWEGPWIIVAIMTALAFVITPALAILEGCGLMSDVARLRAGQTLVSDFAGWGVLLIGGGLWAPAAATTATMLYALYRIRTTWRHLFARWTAMTPGGLSWREEVWPFQWRTAVSWVSGYALLQCFTPILFRTSGPAAAGRMGMTMTMLSMMLTLSMAWLWTKRPTFGMHVARREFAELDALFLPAYIRSIVLMVLGCLGVIAGAWLLGAIGHPWRARILEPAPLVMLAAALCCVHLHWSQSTYLRAHKREAMFVIRLSSAVLSVAAGAVLAPRYGATGMMAGFLGVTFVMLACAGSVQFFRTRRAWQGEM